jgi:hypothetical protein
MKITERDIPLSDEDIDEVEVSLGFKIPQGVREFYLESNGGRITPPVFENEITETLMAELLPLKSTRRETAVEVYQYFAREMYLIPQPFLPFANDAGGDYFFLDTSIPNGSVYVLRHDTDRPDPLINLELEFSEFWASLKD